jgi:hypothetical protein
MMNINPYKEDPNGGKIEVFENNKEMPDYFFKLTDKEAKILENIKQEERVSYLFYSKEAELENARERLYEKLGTRPIIK